MTGQITASRCIQCFLTFPSHQCSVRSLLRFVLPSVPSLFRDSFSGTLTTNVFVFVLVLLQRQRINVLHKRCCSWDVSACVVLTRYILYKIKQLESKRSRISSRDDLMTAERQQQAKGQSEIRFPCGLHHSMYYVTDPWNLSHPKLTAPIVYSTSWIYNSSLKAMR